MPSPQEVKAVENRELLALLAGGPNGVINPNLQLESKGNFAIFTITVLPVLLPANLGPKLTPVKARNHAEEGLAAVHVYFASKIKKIAKYR